MILHSYTTLTAWPCEDKLNTRQDYNTHDGILRLTTLYGSFDITEPILIELLESMPMKRLKEIRQLGVWNYAIKPDNFNRYDHSLGVFTLVRKFGGSLKEQIAALLHDVSHTVFSHVGAFFFVTDAQKMDQYQDNMHEWYLHASGLDKILARYGYTIENILPHDPSFKRLEQELPNLCADRIDYNIRGALWDELITTAEAEMIIDALHFQDGIWYFNNLIAAQLLAQQSLTMTKNIWGSAENFVSGTLLADALREAAHLGIITTDDVHFSTDIAIWDKLMTCNNLYIAQTIFEIEHCHDFFVLDKKKYTHCFARKFRGLDPLVQTENGLRHVSQLSIEYAHTYHALQEECSKPLYIRITHLPLPKHLINLRDAS